MCPLLIHLGPTIRKAIWTEQLTQLLLQVAVMGLPGAEMLCRRKQHLPAHWELLEVFNCGIQAEEFG